MSVKAELCKICGRAIYLATRGGKWHHIHDDSPECGSAS